MPSTRPHKTWGQPPIPPGISSRNKHDTRTKRPERNPWLYPKSVGRNFNEILRVLDALQLAESGPFATPVDWRPGDRAIVITDIPTDQAKELFPDLDVVKPHLHYTSSTSI